MERRRVPRVGADYLWVGGNYPENGETAPQCGDMVP